jgi:hypothetical protein
VKNRFQSLPFKCNLQRYTADCVLRPGPGMGERTTCGTTRDVYLQALEYDSTGRGMSGQEAVSMVGLYKSEKQSADAILARYKPDKSGIQCN